MTAYVPNSIINKIKTSLWTTERARERAKLNKNAIYKRRQILSLGTPAELCRQRNTGGRKATEKGKPRKRSSTNRHKMNRRIKSNDLLVNVNEIYFAVLHLVYFAAAQDSMHWLISFGYTRKMNGEWEKVFMVDNENGAYNCVCACVLTSTRTHSLTHSLARLVVRVRTLKPKHFLLNIYACINL